MIKAASDFLASVKKYRNIMIIIQGSPDPDAIASSYALFTLFSITFDLVNICSII